MNFVWSKKTMIFLSEGPNLDILWAFRDEIGSVRTRIVDLMTISVSKVFFYRVFEDFGLSGLSWVCRRVKQIRKNMKTNAGFLSSQSMGNINL